MRLARHLWCLPVVAAAVLSATLAAPAGAADTHVVDDHRACLERVMLATLRQLHTAPTHWHIQRLDFPAAAATDPNAPYPVYISPTAPCAWIPSIVHHEWMHVQQMSYPLSYSGRDIEIEADCGSWLLGSTVTPYLAGTRRNGGVGCTVAILEVAEILIHHAGVTPVRSIW